jgi:DNA polymerase-4
MVRTITLKLKYSDFRLITRSRTVEPATDSTQVVAKTALGLLSREKGAQGVRLIGVGVSHFEPRTRQLPLFPKGTSQQERQSRLDQAMDEVAERFGTGRLRRGE